MGEGDRRCVNGDATAAAAAESPRLEGPPSAAMRPDPESAPVHVSQTLPPEDPAEPQTAPRRLNRWRK